MTDPESKDPESGTPSVPRQPASPCLIVGLGNPGRNYKQSRHNIGFMALDRLASRLGVTFSRLQHKALVTDSRYAGERIILAKPQTYMNLSGQAVSSLLRFYQIETENLLIVSDDIDLPTGSLRMRPGGGFGGQRGLESIIERLGTEDFPRLRLGVGRPPGRMSPADYVLQTFSKSESELLDQVLNDAADAILAFVVQGIQKAMTLYNRRNEGE
jgi:PTH1 family peptidyl-tRNA hydrolase